MSEEAGGGDAEVTTAAEAAISRGLNGLSDWHGYNDAQACGPGRGPECRGYWFKPGVVATIAAPAVASDPDARAEVAHSMTDDEVWAEVERRHLVKQLGKCRCGRVFEPPVYTRRTR
ncbi:MAG: hypothetical protein M3P97_08560 [Actinomycetota bacterium]|jgi:hypothetical protein|nr:hypothetical protein [Actinomycetota bacterium]